MLSLSFLLSLFSLMALLQLQSGTLTRGCGNCSADDKCIAQLFSTGKSDVSLWYRMWEAVTAVFSVCVRGGQGGVFTGLGKSAINCLSGGAWCTRRKGGRMEERA